MRKCLIVCCLIILALPLCAEEQENSTASDTQQLSISISPLAFLTMLMGNGETNDIPLNNIWFSISLNLSSNKNEYDFGLAKYPNYASLSVEKRIFFNTKYSGFFYGPFVSLDWLYLVLNSSQLPGYSINNDISGDEYHFFGVRFGGDIGFRLRIKDVGFTPKIGLSIPIFYLYGLDNYSRYELARIYACNAGFRAFSMGFKIDFFNQVKKE